MLEGICFSWHRQYFLFSNDTCKVKKYIFDTLKSWDLANETLNLDFMIYKDFQLSLNLKQKMMDSRSLWIFEIKVKLQFIHISDSLIKMRKTKIGFHQVVLQS